MTIQVTGYLPEVLGMARAKTTPIALGQSLPARSRCDTGGSR
jgi:hypothetical protein